MKKNKNKFYFVKYFNKIFLQSYVKKDLSLFNFYFEIIKVMYTKVIISLFLNKKLILRPDF